MKSYDEMTKSVLKRRDEYVRERSIKIKRVKKFTAIICAAAVVLSAVIAAAAVRKSPSLSESVGVIYDGAEGHSETGKKITINEVSYGDFVLTGVYSPMHCEITVLDEKASEEHLGRKLDFSILPDYLKPSEKNSHNEIYRDKSTGKIVDGGITFTYWSKYGEDGLPLSVERGGKGISFTVCRENEEMPDRYKWPENAKASYFGEEKVLVAKWQMEALGEYDFKTGSTPIIPYSMYAAEFSSGGLRFVVSASDFSDDEFIQILADFINANKS